MHFVDTHAHLDDAQFDGDREAVIQRAAEAQVALIIAVGADLASSRAAVTLAERCPSVRATVGVHPHDASRVTRAVLAELSDLAAYSQVVAIGEIGLDYYRDLSPRNVQRAAFEAQLGLATQVNKPAVVHIRDKRGEDKAYRDTLAILGDWIRTPPPHGSPDDPTTRQRSSGVLHCFSGELSHARQAIALGFYLGVDGPVTYPNAGSLQAVVRELPLEGLLLETDCPYLAPQLRRGRRNEPAYLPFIAHKVAELKETGVSQVAEATTRNARRLFRLPRVSGEE